MNSRIGRFLVFSSILFTHVAAAQQGQGGLIPPSDKTKPTTGSTPLESDALRRIDALDNRVAQLSNRLDSELRAANMRFEAVTHATDRAFNVLALLGAFGSFLGGLIVVFSWLRSRKSDKLRRSDYEKERQFYEQRVLDADQRHKTNYEKERSDYDKERQFYEQRVLDADDRHKTSYEKERQFYESRIVELDHRNNESHQTGLDLSRQFASRDANLAHQQMQLGEKVLAHSGDILSQQVESITKLGGVIELVKKTFDMQLTRVSDVDKLLTRLGLDRRDRGQF